MAALAGLTLSAAAQTGDDGADDADPQGRIIARIQDRTDDDGVDDYRIEFGFFPQWAMEDKDPWAEAITTWSDWLPRARYLTKTVIDRRDADDNRRWLRSSLISVPAGPSAQQDGSPDADFEGGGDDQQGLIEGRVVARYNPDSRGRLRVEFGFLPEWAFTSTSSTEEAVEEYGEGLLPRARYLSASMIEGRRGVWLRSSVVDVPPEPPNGCEITAFPVSVVRGEQNENRRIGTVKCEITEELNPISITGTPTGLTIDAVPAGEKRWNLTLSGTAEADVGSYTVEITVRPAQGDPVSESVNIRVDPNGKPEPEIEWEGYRSDEIAVLGEDSPRVENPTATVDGRSVQLSYTYGVDEAAEEVCDVNRNNGRITPLTAGVCIVIARSAETDQYAASESDPVRVTITRVDPELRWDDGYDEEDLRPGGDPVRPREPQPRLSEARGELSYTYSATPSSICAVNSRTGDLTPHRVGECDITVRSAETDKFRAGEVTITIPIGTNLPPECDRIPTVGPLDSGDSRTINLDNYCRDPEGEDLRYSDTQSDDPAVATVRLVGSSLTVTAAPTPAGDSALITVTVADPARNEIEARVSVLAIEIEEPEVRSITCRPSFPEVNERVECTADVRGGEPDSWNWRDGGGGSSSGPRETTYRTSFSEAGDQPVNLTVRNAAGSDNGSITVRVIDEPPEISISCPSSAAVDENITCTVNNRGGAIDSYSWTDSDGGSSSGPRETTYRTSFSSSGTKTVRLTVRNSARSDSDSARVTVTGPPVISVSCPSSAAVNANITCTVDNRGGAITSYSWSDSDGGSGSSSSYRTSFSMSGTKTVRLTARNSAGSDNDSATVIIPVEEPDISVSCPASAAVNANVTCTVNNRGGAIDSYSWSDSDGGSGSSSSYRTSFSSSGTKTVRLTARNSAGSDSDSASVDVNEPNRSPECGSLTSAALTINVGDDRNSVNISQVCRDPDGDRLTFAVSSSSTAVARPSALSGAQRDTFTITGIGRGTATITVSATDPDGLSDSASFQVTVNAPLVAPTINSISCSPSSPTVNQSVSCSASLGGGTPTSYSWSDSDGGSSSGPSETTYRTSFSSSGTKTVRLTVSNSTGSDSDSTSLTVPPPPPVINSISCSPSSPTVNQSVSCSASLSGGAPTSYSWSGGSSSGNSASYSTSFSSPGSETVSLRVSNSAGSDSDSTSVNVIGPPVISISCSPSSIEEGDRTTCSVSSNSGGSISSYSWSASGGSPSSGSSSTYRPRFNTAGNYTVSLTASNSAGSSSPPATYSITVTVEPPDIDISCTAYVFQGNSARCTVDNDGGTISSYSWSGGSSSGSSSSYRPSFSSFGRQTVRLTASNAGGSDSDSIPVDVLAWPAPTYGRCGSDGIRVYWFNSSGYDKRWLNMDWADVAARVPGWGEHMIGHMSQSACNSWPNGPEVNTGNWPLP